MKPPKVNDAITIIDMRPQGQRVLPFERQVRVIDKTRDTFTTNEGTFYTSTGWHVAHEIRAFAPCATEGLTSRCQKLKPAS